MAGALGRLAASITLDVSQWTVGTQDAQRAAATMATNVDRTIRDMEAGVRSAVNNIGAALAAGFGVGAIVAMSKSALESADNMRHAAEMAQMSVEQFSMLAVVAKQTGTSTETLEMATKKLSVAIADTAGGGSKYSALFKGLGVDITQASLTSDGFNRVLLALADAFASSEDGPVKVAAAVKLLGRNGAEAIPFLNLGGAAIKAMQEEALRLGRVMDADTAEAAHKFRNEMEALTNRSTWLAQALANTVLPSLNAVVKAMIDGRAEGGLYTMVVRGLTEAFVQIKGDGPAAELAKIDQRVRELTADVKTARDQSWWATFGQVGPEAQRTAQAALDEMTRRRDALQHEIFVAELAAQDARAIAAAQARRHRRRLDPNALGLGDNSDASTSASDNYIARLQEEKEKLSLAGVETLKYREALIEIQKIKAAGGKVDEERIKQLAREVDGAVAAKEAYKKLAEGEAEEIKSRDAMTEAARKNIDQVIAGNKALQTEIDTLGMDSTARALAINAKEREKAVNAALGTGLEDVTKKVYDDRAALIAWVAASQEQLGIWKQLTERAGQFFGDLVMNGKSAFDRLRQELKSFAQEVIAFFAQRFVLQMVAGLAGSSVIGNAAASTLLGGAGQGIGSSLVGGLVSGAGTGFMGAFGTGVLTGGGDFVGTGLAGLAGNAALAAGATDAFAAAVAAAVPVIGWIVAIGAVLYSVFGSSGGGPKGGGSWSSMFNSAGAAIGPASGRVFTPNNADPQVATAGNMLAQGFYSTLQQLGGTTRGVGFTLGFDTDPQGSAQNRVTGVVYDSRGRAIFSQRDRNIGRDQSQIGPEMQLEASRMLLAALQSSQLPAYLSHVFDGLTPSSATQAQIDAALKQATALKTIFDVVSRNPLQDIATATAASSNQFQTALTNNEAAIRRVMQAYDGSSTAAQNLATATTQYYNAQLQLLAGVTQASQAVRDMFNQTFRSIEMSGLDRQGQYDYLQREAAQLQAQALASTDPATIQRLAQQINADINQAFGLLSPEQQAAQRGAFLQQGRATQQALEARLESIQRQAAAALQRTLDDIKTIIGANADSQTAAANTQLAAANTQNVAANTPRQIVIVLQGGTQQVATFG